jgi:hypothetical protein
MELWQMDTVGGFLLADGSHVKVLTGIDNHSGLCVGPVDGSGAGESIVLQKRVSSRFLITAR